MKEFDINEVKLHYKPGDVWVIIDNNVYDLSFWAKHHPGGDFVINSVAGSDCTQQFLTFHLIDLEDISVDIRPDYSTSNHKISKLLESFKIGFISPSQENSLLTEEFKNIIKDINKEGLFKTNNLFYVKKWFIQGILLLYVLFLIKFNYTTISAIVLGFFWQQLSFLGHDYGHNSVSHSTEKDYIGSFVVTLLFGVSGQWWKNSHNIHHTITNSINYDPDIQHLPFFAITSKMFNGFYSEYYKKYFKFNNLSRWLVRYQHILYYPIMMIARYNLYLQSWLFILFKEKVYNRKYEILAMAGYFILYFYLLSLIPSLSLKLWFNFIAHSIAGIIHLQITLSHFCMTTYFSNNYENKDFITTQLETTMNISCHPLLDWFHGGLQFQIEHHLLPKLPRHNLRYVSERYIKPFVKKHNLPYHEYGFFTSIKKVWNIMKNTASKTTDFLSDVWMSNG